MKKLFMVAMAIVVAAGFVACTKEDVSAPTYKVEFTVGDKGGFGVNSRAVKTAWAEGDQILIITKPMSGSYYDVAIANSDANTIRLIYNGSAWTVDRALTAEEIVARGVQGIWYAIHYRVKDGNKVGLGDDLCLKNHYGGEVLEDYGSFTITDGVINLGEINMKLALYGELIQMSVPGLDLEDNSDWSLTLMKGNYEGGNGTFTNNWHSKFLSLQAETVFFTTSPGLGNMAVYYDAPYVVNGTDASFVFRYGEVFGGESDTALHGKYKILLWNEDTSKAYLYTVDRGEYDAVNDKYEVNLEFGKAYRLPVFDGDGAQTNWKQIAI